MDFTFELQNNYDKLSVSYYSVKQEITWRLVKLFDSVLDYEYYKGKITTKYPMKIINRFVRKGYIVNEITDYPF